MGNNLNFVNHDLEYRCKQIFVALYNECLTPYSSTYSNSSFNNSVQNKDLVILKAKLDKFLREHQTIASIMTAFL